MFPSSTIYVDSRNKKIVCMEFNCTTVYCVNRKTSHSTVTLREQKKQVSDAEKVQVYFDICKRVLSFTTFLLTVLYVISSILRLVYWTFVI